MKKYIFTEEQQKQIFDLCLNKKWGYRKIAKSMNIGEPTVLRYMRENNLHGVKQRKHQVDEDYFEKIDSPEKAYWLRMLYADGCVSPSRRTISLIQKPDESGIFLLQEFQKALRSDNDIKIIKQNSW